MTGLNFFKRSESPVIIETPYQYHATVFGSDQDRVINIHFGYDDYYDLNCDDLEALKCKISQLVSCLKGVTGIQFGWRESVLTMRSSGLVFFSSDILMSFMSRLAKSDFISPFAANNIKEFITAVPSDDEAPFIGPINRR